MSWRELVQRLAPGCKFSPPATVAQLTAVERILKVALPEDLRELLLETNGIAGPHGFGLVWSAEQIETDNAAFRANADFRELYMPFVPLLFFGDQGGGDQYAFRILAGVIRDQDVYEWVHENDSRQWFAGGMRDYLARALGHESYFNTLR
jgi:SMI1-KNR4 cell-wall